MALNSFIGHTEELDKLLLEAQEIWANNKIKWKKAQKERKRRDYEKKIQVIGSFAKKEEMPGKTSITFFFNSEIINLI